jgi:uncharacterized protein YuzB (UPF0349 family)
MIHSAIQIVESGMQIIMTPSPLDVPEYECLRFCEEVFSFFLKFVIHENNLAHL